MKYLAFLLLFPFATLACSTDPDDNELTPYATIVNSAKVAQEIEAIGIFVPSEVENAQASSMNIAYFNGEKLMLQTSINTDAADETDIKIDPNVKDYSISYFYLNMSQVSNVQVTVHYRFPPTKDGGMIMCGPMRNYKLSDLMANKT
jgi:hypothetical protein